jgi:hypothetical protein
MAERRAHWAGWRWVAFATALLLALGGAAFLVLSVQEHDDARDQLAGARRELASARTNSSRDTKALAKVQATIGSVKDQLGAIGQGAIPVADLDQRDLDAVRAAVQAGLAGDVTAYNAAVDQRETLDPQHDAAVEQLRQQANAVITALDQLN